MPRPDIGTLGATPPVGTPAPTGTRDVWFPAPTGRVAVPVWRRDRLPSGTALTGPAVVEEFSATTVLLPGDRAVVGPLGDLAIDCTGAP